MKKLTRALVLGGGVSMLALTVIGANTRDATAQASQSIYRFDIPSKPLLAALADYTATTGVQIVRPGGARISGQSAPVTGQQSAEAALATLLSGTGLDYRFTGPRTATVTGAGDSQSTGLEPAPEGAVELPPITVGSDLARGGVSEVVIGQADLDRKNPTDLKQVFAGEPGIKVGSSLPMSQKVYVHGIEETNLAVSIDGSRQNNKVFHHNATTLIDPSLLKAARVDAGVAPADAGPGALGGAIAYETKDARDLLLDGRNIGAFVKETFNTNGRVSTTNLAGYGAAENGLEFLGYFTLGRGSKFEDGDGLTVQGTGTNIMTGIGKLAYESDSGYRMEVSHEQLEDDAVRPYRANIGFITGRPPLEPRFRDYRLNRQNTVFTFSDTSPEGWWDPKVVLAYSQSEIVTTAHLRPLFTPYRVAGDTSSFNGKAENRFAFALGSVTAGVDFYQDKAVLDDPFTPANENASNVGLYAQARLEPWQRTRVSFGLRGDHQIFSGTQSQDFTNSGLSANMSGEVDLIENFLTAKAGYSHVWAGVPLAENFIMNRDWLYGAGPEPVTSDNVTAGLVARYQGFTLEGTVFRTEINDARQARFAIGTPAAYGSILNRDIDSQGFELGAGYDWGSGFVKLKYASIDVDIDGRVSDSDTGNYLATPVGEIITLTAAHTFQQWGVTIGGDLEFAPEYDRVAPGSPPYPAYTVVNAFAEYTPVNHSNLTFRAQVDNLFDETYSDRATYGHEFGTVSPLREPGRAFILSASAKF
jgi:hemoglobin/transferrin/lactoferrin receptor protein